LKYRGVIVDLDGVVWRGDKPIKSNIDALKLLQDKGIKTIFLSNNATRSRLEYIDKIKKFGLAADLKTVINSAFGAAQYIKERGGERAFIVGEAGLYYELSIAGILPVTLGSPAEYVVVGLDRFMTYQKLEYASKLIRGGAYFIAANTDTTYPSEEHVAPGAGSLVSFLEASTGKKPDIVIGKPNPWILDLALRLNNLRRRDVLIIGDRLDTDILLGINAGVDTLLVLTGISRLEDIEKTGINPTYVAKNLYDFVNTYPEYFDLL
jgi:4-nitrophenyl phosphatase